MLIEYLLSLLYCVTLQVTIYNILILSKDKKGNKLYGHNIVQIRVIYTDPIAKSCDEAEAELINCLPKGVVTYKGRRGSQTVNHTEESLNFLNDFRKNKKSWKTRFNNG